MSNTKHVDSEGSNELQKSADEITPIYLDAIEGGISNRLKERFIEDDLLKINFITTSSSNTYNPVLESGLLHVDAHGDKELHSRIVELAQKHSHEPNLSKDTK